MGSVLGVRLAARPFSPTLQAGAAVRSQEWGRLRTAEMAAAPVDARCFGPTPQWLPPHRSHQEGFLYVRNAGVYGPFDLIPGQSGARDPVRYTVPNQCPNRLTTEPNGAKASSQATSRHLAGPVANAPSNIWGVGSDRRSRYPH